MNNSEKLFREIITEQDFLLKILEIVSSFKLPNWYVGAGAIAQIVWNHLHGYSSLNGIKDIDIVYYDSTDLSSESEIQIRDKIKNALKEFPVEFDIVNEARVHLWYEEEFSKKIEQYKSSEDAISTWPTTASAIGLTLNSENELVVFAPFGLDDLISQIVRPNKKLISKYVFRTKSERWKKVWPNLKIIGWEEN